MSDNCLGLLLSTAASQEAFLNPSPDAQTSSVHPRLNIGPGGHIFLVWEKERDGQPYDIYCKRSTDQRQTWPQEERWLDVERRIGNSQALVRRQRGSVPPSATRRRPRLGGRRTGHRG